MSRPTSEAISTQDTPLADIEQEARRLLDAAGLGGIVARVLGGVAIAMLARRPIPEPLQRSYADIDLIIKRGDAPRLTPLLGKLGYEPNQRFNNLHGHRRLLFYDEVNGRQLDVFVGTFTMCHELALEDRLELVPLTLTPADLLLTKLQIVEVNAKDLADAASLLYECEVGEADTAELINLRRLTEIMGKDWGWYTTVSDNLTAVAGLAREKLTVGEAETVSRRIGAIQDAAERAPKSTGWKLRARVGRRLQWYELPEEVAR